MSTHAPRPGDDRFESAGPESPGHLWPKVELYCRKEAREAPYFEGEYHFERRVADRAPDAYILGEPNRWVEFVAGSPQDFRQKTREALRLGFAIHWVFHADHGEQMHDARAALEPELAEAVSFGVYSPELGLLDLGDAIGFDTYAFPVESMVDFRPDAILGYRAGAAHVGKTEGWYDLGVFGIAGDRRRVLVLTPRGRCLRTLSADRAIAADSLDSISTELTQAELAALVDAGRVTRLGPVKRYAGDR